MVVAILGVCPRFNAEPRLPAAAGADWPGHDLSKLVVQNEGVGS